MLNLLAHEKSEFISPHLLINEIEQEVLNHIWCQEFFYLVLLCYFLSTRYHNNHLSKEATNDTLDIGLGVKTVDVHHLDADEVLLVFSLLHKASIKLVLKISKRRLLPLKLACLLSLAFLLNLLRGSILDTLLYGGPTISLSLHRCFMSFHLKIDVIAD